MITEHIGLKIVSPTPHNSDWYFSARLRVQWNEGKWYPWSGGQFTIFYCIIFLICEQNSDLRNKRIAVQNVGCI